MSYPPSIKESEATDLGWQRRVRDAVNALIKRTSGVGPTSDRPRNPDVGSTYYDVTLSRPIWWTGAAWINAAGTVV